MGFSTVIAAECRSSRSPRTSRARKSEAHIFRRPIRRFYSGECSHYVELVSNPDQMPRIFEKAIRRAIAERGVSVVVIPGDIALQTTDAKPPKWTAPRRPQVRPDDQDLGAPAELLNAARPVTICAAPGAPARTTSSSALLAGTLHHHLPSFTLLN